MAQKDTMSTETHMEVFARLLKAGNAGIHGHPGPKKGKK